MLRVHAGRRVLLEGERERERERHTHTHTDRQRERERERESLKASYYSNVSVGREV